MIFSRGAVMESPREGDEVFFPLIVLVKHHSSQLRESIFICGYCSVVLNIGITGNVNGSTCTMSAAWL